MKSSVSRSLQGIIWHKRQEPTSSSGPRTASTFYNRHRRSRNRGGIVGSTQETQFSQLWGRYAVKFLFRILVSNSWPLVHCGSALFASFDSRETSRSIDFQQTRVKYVTLTISVTVWNAQSTLSFLSLSSDHVSSRSLREKRWSIHHALTECILVFSKHSNLSRHTRQKLSIINKWHRKYRKNTSQGSISTRLWSLTMSYHWESVFLHSTWTTQIRHLRAICNRWEGQYFVMQLDFDKFFQRSGFDLLLFITYNSSALRYDDVAASRSSSRRTQFDRLWSSRTSRTSSARLSKSNVVIELLIWTEKTFLWGGDREGRARQLPRLQWNPQNDDTRRER